LNFFKKTKICQKCNKTILPDEESYYGLCFDCYIESVKEQIKDIGRPPKPKEKFSYKKLPRKIWTYIKNLFIDF